ncbi:winged helix-turn-helix domain-containing protein [Streptomyces sp. CC210A]|uniref:GntR family transcriptional regulator n=1 Tax=Streptomyces sp. CC210A TaxID=2898184 RepID=UPI001F23B52C|nr:winged helix-turn-helix domain-containing protein [Streptomyces sp. CC210A]
MGEIDYGSYIPPYQQIAAEIVADIKRGTLQPGRAIPSEPQLVQRYGVARATVRRTVAYLRDQGYVFTIPHRGSYVALDLVERGLLDPPPADEPESGGSDD